MVDVLFLGPLLCRLQLSEGHSVNNRTNVIEQSKQESNQFDNCSLGKAINFFRAAGQQPRVPLMT